MNTDQLILIVNANTKTGKEKATQSFGRPDHWNTESETEHNEAYEAHMQYQSTLKEISFIGFTDEWFAEHDGKEVVEGKHFIISRGKQTFETDQQQWQQMSRSEKDKCFEKIAKPLTHGKN